MIARTEVNPAQIAAAGAPSLFSGPDYYQPLEDSGCAVPANGWTRVELDDGGQSPAPCYEKTHSWGEFVFDQAFARAYQQRGRDYYPKLVCCLPYTPVPGPRLYSIENARRLQALTVQRGSSSAHVLFLPPAEAAMLQGEGWLRREQPRYVWNNTGYALFEDFLGQLISKRRKNIRGERRAVAASGLRIEWRAGCELDARAWQEVFALYAGTYAVRGQSPYLNQACLRAWAQNFGARMQFCLALDEAGIAAMAFYFVDGDTLYGRHWGAREQHAGLHFELCCYQGIDYAIRHRLRRFDAGVQGEHKLLRGFSPEASLSMHWFADEDFHRAVEGYLQRERSAVRSELEALAAHDGYRQTS